MRIYILIITLLQTCLLGISQEIKPKKTRRMSIQELYVQPGLLLQGDRPISPENYIKINPSSLLSKFNYSDFDNNGYNTSSAQLTFTGLIGIKFRNKERTDYKTNPILRLGIHTGSGGNSSNYFSNNNRTPYDTLISLQTGEEFYIDSITNEFLSFNYTSRQIRLDASLILSIRPEKRWSFFYGLGFNFGVSYFSETTLSYNKSSSIDGEIFESSYYNFTSNPISNYNERKTQATNFGYSIYTPLGLNFRLGKKGGKWEKTLLYYEIRPLVNVTSIPQLQVLTSSGVQQGIGMKFNL